MASLTRSTRSAGLRRQMSGHSVGVDVQGVGDELHPGGVVEQGRQRQPGVAVGDAAHGVEEVRRGRRPRRRSHAAPPPRWRPSGPGRPRTPRAASRPMSSGAPRSSGAMVMMRRPSTKVARRSSSQVRRVAQQVAPGGRPCVDSGEEGSLHVEAERLGPVGGRQRQPGAHASRRTSVSASKAARHRRGQERGHAAARPGRGPCRRVRRRRPWRRGRPSRGRGRR